MTTEKTEKIVPGMRVHIKGMRKHGNHFVRGRVIHVDRGHATVATDDGPAYRVHVSGCIPEPPPPNPAQCVLPFELEDELAMLHYGPAGLTRRA